MDGPWQKACYCTQRGTLQYTVATACEIDLSVAHSCRFTYRVTTHLNSGALLVLYSKHAALLGTVVALQKRTNPGRTDTTSTSVPANGKTKRLLSRGVGPKRNRFRDHNKKDETCQLWQNEIARGGARTHDLEVSTLSGDKS